MSKSRVFQDQSLSVGQHVTLDSANSHHLSRVLRLAQGDRVTLFNGQGGEYSGVISQVSKKQVEIDLQTFDDVNVESPLDICLVQGLARGEKMDFIVQKAVELGVKRIQSVMTEYCNVKLSKERAEKRLRHWQLVAISACEQSGRTFVPEIHEPVSLANWMNLNKNQQSFILCPHSDSLNLASQKLETRSVNLLIGPEGGFSPNEITAAIDAGVKPIKLGPRILRTETAPLAAISLFQFCFGDF